MIHPEFFTSAVLAKLSFRAAHLFAGLWVYCDDMGRGEDDSSFIRARVFPRRDDVTAADVEDDLKALAEEDLICRYEVGGSQFLHVPSWHEHQRISHPSPPRCPPCRECEVEFFRVWWSADDTVTERVRKAEKAMRRKPVDPRRDRG